MRVERYRSFEQCFLPCCNPPFFFSFFIVSYFGYSSSRCEKRKKWSGKVYGNIRNRNLSDTGVWKEIETQLYSKSIQYAIANAESKRKRRFIASQTCRLPSIRRLKIPPPCSTFQSSGPCTARGNKASFCSTTVIWFLKSISVLDTPSPSPYSTNPILHLYRIIGSLMYFLHIFWKFMFFFIIIEFSSNTKWLLKSHVMYSPYFLITRIRL